MKLKSKNETISMSDAGEENAMKQHFEAMAKPFEDGKGGDIAKMDDEAARETLDTIRRMFDNVGQNKSKAE